MRTIAIIVAGGSGTRFGAQIPKQFLELGGKPILMRTVEAFEKALADGEHEIVVTLPADQIGVWQDCVNAIALPCPTALCPVARPAGTA